MGRSPSSLGARVLFWVSFSFASFYFYNRLLLVRPLGYPLLLRDVPLFFVFWSLCVYLGTSTVFPPSDRKSNPCFTAPPQPPRLFFPAAQFVTRTPLRVLFHAVPAFVTGTLPFPVSFSGRAFHILNLVSIEADFCRPPIQRKPLNSFFFQSLFTF